LSTTTTTERERELKSGEKGAGEQAIKKAKEPLPLLNPLTTTTTTRKKRKINQIVNEIAQHPNTTEEEEEEEEEDENASPPKFLLVKFGILPALIRYQGLERNGIRSRNWGNSHDGVSLRVESIEPFNVSFLSLSLSPLSLSLLFFLRVSRTSN
jgi:hypothetical protein